MGLRMTSVLMHAKGVLATELGYNIIVMNIDTSNYYDLDDVATVIWKKLAIPASVADLCLALEAEFDGAFDVIQADVLEFIAELVSEGLVEIIE